MKDIPGTDIPAAEIPRLLSADSVLHGVLKIEWSDGYHGVVDLRPLVERGGVFSSLATPERFTDFTIGEHGHALIWLGDDGQEIDIGADSLRRRAETQMELHRLAG